MIDIFRLFKKRDWEPRLLDKLVGQFGEMTIEILNFPFREDPVDCKRAFRNSDFGFEFLTELHNQLGDYKTIIETLKISGEKTVFVNLPDLHPMQVTISGDIGKNSAEADSNIADALLNALKGQNIDRK